MAKLWTSPKFPKGRVDWAGDVLLGTVKGDLNAALEIINNWRSSHSYPLQALKVTLRTRARNIDPKSVTVQRLKRLSSMVTKLGRNRNMHLSQMQDIGGCRAVINNIGHVNKLVKAYVESYAKNPNVRAEFVKAFDYISKPKIDGYRSVHLIYKYRTKSRRHRVWNGLRIEIQIRSKLQHAWATAVETVDAFTGQGLKVSGGTGTEKKDWGRFFALMASAIACREKCNLVPDTPPEPQLLQELKALSERLKVESTLAGWSYAMKSLGVKAPSDAVLFLLVLDTEEYTYNWTPYKRAMMKQAQLDYMKAEKDIQSTPGRQAVLVSADSMGAVRAAYPNFYADTRAFGYALQYALKGIKNGKNKGIGAVHEPAGEATESSAQ
jgi:RelA/SpoT family protein